MFKSEIQATVNRIVTVNSVGGFLDLQKTTLLTVESN